LLHWLVAEVPPDYEQRLDQHRQIGQVLDQLLDPAFKFGRPLSSQQSHCAVA
jgi:hypothetical protein